MKQSPDSARGNNNPHSGPTEEVDSSSDSPPETPIPDGGSRVLSPWEIVPEQPGLQRDILSALVGEQLGAETVRCKLAPRYKLFVTNSRFYPALDDLVERSLVRRIDGAAETTEYALTDAGRQAVREHLEWLADMTGPMMAEVSTIGGDDATNGLDLHVVGFDATADTADPPTLAETAFDALRNHHGEIIADVVPVVNGKTGARVHQNSPEADDNPPRSIVANDGSLEDLTSDERAILAHLVHHEGRIHQSTIAESLDWSRSKTSTLVTAPQRTTI